MKPSELLSDESKWCQGSAAQDANGVWIMADWPEAVKWCMLGAVCRCNPTNYYTDKQALAAHLGCNDVIGWNDADGRTYAEVIAALRACNL